MPIGIFCSREENEHSFVLAQTVHSALQLLVTGDRGFLIEGLHLEQEMTIDLAALDKDAVFDYGEEINCFLCKFKIESAITRALLR